MTVPPSSSVIRSPGHAARGLAVSARVGFSLIELLIVLAILTAVTALIAPGLRGPMERSRLRSSAVDLQNIWGKARTLAVRRGQMMVFRCRLGGRYWRIEQSGSAIEVTTEDGDNATASGLTAEGFDGPDLLAEQTDDGRLMREGWLPEGITFAELDVADDETFGQTSDPVSGLEVSDRTEEVQDWSPSLRFYPEGRSQDARLRMAGADDFFVTVAMRGLTAAVRFTPPRRRRRLVGLPGGEP